MTHSFFNNSIGIVVSKVSAKYWAEMPERLGVMSVAELPQTAIGCSPRGDPSEWKTCQLLKLIVIRNKQYAGSR